ncbi:MAG: hypothetical protein OXG72_09310, partial [Acidobacteria bacterium]|nr:hypothetical protein [Acidobacteriota bacterium]
GETATAPGAERETAKADDGLPEPRHHQARRHVQSHRPVYPVERDAWAATEEGEVLAVLRDIRDRFGTSPS